MTALSAVSRSIGKGTGLSNWELEFGDYEMIRGFLRGVIKSISVDTKQTQV